MLVSFWGLTYSAISSWFQARGLKKYRNDSEFVYAVPRKLVAERNEQKKDIET